MTGTFSHVETSHNRRRSDSGLTLLAGKFVYGIPEERAFVSIFLIKRSNKR
jgi:hypothetical protein